MLSFRLSNKLVPLLLILGLLPFFEGCETASGLFLVHSLTLLTLFVAIFYHSQLIIPRFFVYFIPFGAAILLSTFLAPYKYSAVLQLWDYCVATLFAVAVFSIFRSDGKEVGTNLFVYFFLLVAGILVTLFAENSFGVRMTGSFTNPNDFGTFCLLCIVFGMFLLEQEANQRFRIALIISLVLLMMLVALSSSRAAFIAAAIFALLYILRKRPGNFVSLCIFGGLAVAAGALIYRFSQHPDPLQYYRLRIWKYSLQGILQDPYLGVGLNMLRYNAARFNFPSSVELGRFSRVATSADNQYLQILVETGFLGLFTFLIGWLAIYFSLRKASPRFFTLSHAFIVVSIVSLFSMPLNNTAITLLFFFLVCLPLAFGDTDGAIAVRLNSLGRIGSTVFLFVLFAFLVFLPYMADREYNAAVRAADPHSARRHLDRALLFNPYQPYYRFVFVKRVVDSQAKIDLNHGLYLVHALNESIRMNPLEPEFYVYRARILRRLLEISQNLDFYTEAVSSYQAAIDKSPYNVFLRAEFAAFAAKFGRFPVAETELQKALEAEPVFLNARLMLTQMKIQQNDWKGAQQEFQKAEWYYERYRGYIPVDNPNYYRQLLSVDANQMAQIKKTVYSR